ncbi:hypothetical protein N7495_006931 [Penicillium taxi]|uniref:uncharacterized protein n=1 Tax=Penicillium taxi TaxID=168475 RepID=UPI0025451982|nr:uncharacterized protein N7495_006931 [Penicillium taxi]KAJ5895240.1 hypothetical protein N7495_006931 [Penicillium taxi]
MIVARQSFIRPYLLSLLAVSAVSSKALHLLQHFGSVPQTQLILFFPTFFIQEALLLGAVWFILQRSTGLRSTLAVSIAAVLTLLTFILASSQIGFYLVTGSEVRWDAATSVGNDPEGRKLMLSGLKSFLAAAVVLLATSWVATPGIWVVTHNWASMTFINSLSEEEEEELPLAKLQRRPRKQRLVRFWTIVAALVTFVLWLIRPNVPYHHISGGLPFTFFAALGSKSSSNQVQDQEFPLPQSIGEEYWEAPNGHFKGWAPGVKEFNDLTARPAWASNSLPPGFQRWEPVPEAESDPFYEEDGDEERTPDQKNHYNPANDPLRITNLDQSIVEPLSRALKDHKIPITHVVLVMMESARKDIFPLKSGSSLHREILSSYHTQSTGVIEQLQKKLSLLTPVAEQLTGESGGFASYRHLNDTVSSYWKDSAEPGMGGINVQGVLTGSSLSFKSAVMNYCGVGPIPVDFMEEVKSEIYQPCIMQIFELFNQLKQNETLDEEKGSDMHNRKWNSVFLQSITGLYDKQDVLNTHMGFKKAVYSEQISERTASYYHEGMEEINYFGYPEREIYPYLQDTINHAIANNERLFLSHFTSTTHHPWATPSGFHDEEYFSDDSLMGKHEDMNSYLNTVRYVDTWLGDILKVLDDTGIANETLVVFIGDHGQAFPEDSPVSGTYENGHVSNFRIPLTLRHPLLPKIQITANASSMSVVPTILDLLVQTKSLNEIDSTAALDLMNEYEGQSLIRPYKATHNGRQAWNFGIINAGGTLLSVGSAAVPYRLILPLTQDFEYVFSNLDTDPDEQNPLRGWSVEEISSRVQAHHGDKAVQWLVDAGEVGRWWVQERKRLWNYS